MDRQNPVLFATKPIATANLANEDGRRCGSARRRLDELLVDIPSMTFKSYAAQPMRAQSILAVIPPLKPSA
ncbi:hypothetical protein ACYCVF_35820 [Bradyrhizobium sp. 1.29L]